MCRSLVRPAPWAVAGILAVVMIGMRPTIGDDSLLGGSSGIVEGLAVLGDLQPVAALESTTASLSVGGAASVRPALVRQSVPARDRALSYRDADVFALSKAVMPLLVADLEPRGASIARPMSGRSVGARPAAAWTRTMPTLTESVTPSRASFTHW